jgi:hypothetical protein
VQRASSSSSSSSSPARRSANFKAGRQLGPLRWRVNVGLRNVGYGASGLLELFVAVHPPSLSSRAPLSLFSSPRRSAAATWSMQGSESGAEDFHIKTNRTSRAAASSLRQTQKSR